jgi:hypothetical protein
MPVLVFRMFLWNVGIYTALQPRRPTLTRQYFRSKFIPLCTCIHCNSCFHSLRDGLSVPLNWWCNGALAATQYSMVLKCSRSRFPEFHLLQFSFNAVKPLFIVSEETAKCKRWMQEKDSYGKVIYMGDVWGPGKVNNTCVKTMHAGMIDIEVSLYYVLQVTIHLQS